MRGLYDERALQTVQRALQGNVKAQTFNNLKTRSNPRGDGILVSAWDDERSGGTARWSRRRHVWLVLDGKVYPVGGGAVGSLGRSVDMPNDVQQPGSRRRGDRLLLPEKVSPPTRCPTRRGSERAGERPLCPLGCGAAADGPSRRYRSTVTRRRGVPAIPFMSYRPRPLRRDRLPDQLLRPFDRGIKACLCPRLFLRYLAQNLINPRDGAKRLPGPTRQIPPLQ